jgi:hypothetical protein
MLVGWEEEIPLQAITIGILKEAAIPALSVKVFMEK